MNCSISQKNPVVCPFPGCISQSLQPSENPGSGRFVRKRGKFYRSSDQKYVQRFLCMGCKRSFSRATLAPEWMQKKRFLNHSIYLLLNSCTSQRRIAQILGINRKTVARKLAFHQNQSRLRHQGYLRERAREGLKAEEIQFDEMESFERSKCLPLSIPLIVEYKTRKILGFRVCVMPAKGPLAEISRKKYGLRPDERRHAARELLSEVGPSLSSEVHITSDENPKYPNWIRSTLGKVKHTQVKGQRGAHIGQGELKKIGFDPLFSLNHTAAMLRANINRLVRKTWCTTKRADQLAAHIQVYVDYHNRVLTEFKEEGVESLNLQLA